MIITKILGLSTVFTKSKKVKIAILLIEIVILMYAIAASEEASENNKRLEQ
ncbi:hypothetical protein [Lacinutrix chionoecetis]